MSKRQVLGLNALLAIVLGIVTTFSFAPYLFFPITVFTVLGLLILWIFFSKTPKQAFLFGYLFGLGLFGVGVYWVYISIHTVANVPILLSLLITVGFIAILSLFPATVGLCLNRYFPNNNKQKILYAFPALWVISEWIRNFLFTGFPWLFLGYSQTNSFLRGYAPIFSVYGVTLAITLSSALILNAYMKFKKKAFKAIFINVLVLIIIWLLGNLICFIPWTVPQGKPLSVALVQGDIAQEIKWSPEHIKLSFDRYTDLTKPLWGKYNLIVWPEAAIPVPLLEAADFINEMDTKAIENNSILLLGIPVETKNKSYYNALIQLGAKKGIYLKRHLVPFGEYTPLSSYLSHMLNFMDVPMSDMVPGKYFQNPLILFDTKVVASICYEIAFPELSRITDRDVGFLLVVTNDAWFGDSNAKPQHLQMAEMRAQELGRPILFVSNNGITAIIAPDGKITAALPKDKVDVLTGNIQPVQGITPWMNNGPYPILFICVIFLIIARRTNKKVQGSLEENVNIKN